METINKATTPVTGVVPLGTIRRNNRNLRIRRDADETGGVRFKLAAFDGDDTTDLGAVTIPASGGPQRRWLPAALAIGISKGRLTEASIIKCLRGLVRSIETGEPLSAEHGFVKDTECPYVFAVEELEVWRA